GALAAPHRNIGGQPGPHGAVDGGERDDLRRTEVFGAENLSRHGSAVAQAHVLWPYAEDEITLLEVFMDLRHHDGAFAELHGCRSAPQPAAEIEKIHRRRADEIGDEQ